jgi:hypothetical protein
MTIPALMAADDNPGSLETLDGTLRRRYEHDYLIISEASPGTALGRLRELRSADRPVAVMMAASAMRPVPAASSSPRPAASSRPPSGCWWSRGAARPRPACVFPCRWSRTGRRPRPFCTQWHTG